MQEKYIQAVGIINTNLQKFHPKKSVVSFSGGKDSTLLLWIVRNECRNLEIDPNDITILFNNTGVEYPQTITFVKKICEEWKITNFIETKPEKTFWQCVKEYGYPSPKSSRTPKKGKKNKRPLCCEYLKERPRRKVLKNFDAVYLGITAIESHLRQIKAVTNGTCYYAIADKIQKIHPLLYFTEPEIWQLTSRFGIPHNQIYDLGVDRCGCMPCTAYKKWKENLQKSHPKMYRKIMKDMGQELITA
jgi:phosphoadenosine phosphosulfate reductase